MSLRVFVSFVSLFFFAGFATAGIYAPACSPSWKGSVNGLGQNWCTVAAYLISTCHGGSFTINALTPGNAYTGPTTLQHSDLCECNTVVYSLMSACDACQGANWPTYKEFVRNCDRVMTPGSFPNPVPAGTRVPHWALIDVTKEGTWDFDAAAAVGDAPEAGPGTKIGS